MAFVRTKKVKGSVYHQVVENYRNEDGDVRQRVLVHLGHPDSVDAALKVWPREIRRLRREGGRIGNLYANASDAFEHTRSVREQLRRADSYKTAADDLEKKLEKLRHLRQSGAL